MRLLIIAVACLAGLTLAACGPTFNWRETPITATSLVAMFPCKPQKASRVVALGGKDVELTMTGCDAGGVTVAIGHARIADPNMVGPVLVQWREATLIGMHASSSTVSAFQLERARVWPQSVLLKAVGVRSDGRALALQGTWFARDTEVFAALMYADTLSPDVAGTFFSGLKFR